ncbi:hypothetical protein PCE1_004764 [Barthelona sp. PCE]
MFLPKFFFSRWANTPEKHNLVQLAFSLIFFGLCYMIPNKLHFIDYHLLPTLFNENVSIPIVDWTLILYFSSFVQPLVATYLIRNSERTTRFWFLVRIMMSVQGIIFVLYPTYLTYRPDPLSRPTLWQPVWKFLHMADTPLNCCPSMHVSVGLLCTIAVFKFRNLSVGLPTALWSLGIIVSTLTTKQHYIVDIIGAAVLVLLILPFLLIEPKLKKLKKE